MRHVHTQRYMLRVRWKARLPARLASMHANKLAGFALISLVLLRPTDALRDVDKRSDPHMGYARIDEEVCIAYKGYRCEVCYRVCPLIDEAITLDFQSMERDDIHTKFIPTISKQDCTGCGLCVERCAVSEPYVPIRIVTLAEQAKEQTRG